MRLPKVNLRRLLIVVHDVAATAMALVASIYIRFEEGGIAERWSGILLIFPIFLIYASFIYAFFDLYRSKWRFASLPDLRNIFWASCVISLSLLVLDYVLVSPNFYGSFFFGKITIGLVSLLLMFLLGAPRLAYRYFRFTRTRQAARATGAAPILIIGRAAEAEVLLRAVESGAVRKVWPVGILSPSFADHGQAVRGVPVLGGLDYLERATAEFAERGTNVTRLVLTHSALDVESNPETLLMRARRLGLTTSRLPSLEDGPEAPRLTPVNVEDLLLRPSVTIDRARLEELVKNKSIAVTGGGGSIGSELCQRITRYGAARLLVIENSEPALHNILETLSADCFETVVEGKIGDVRERDRIFKLLAEFKPEIVFHAAALKHVPLLEHNWEEGTKTNVFGSVNVADAACAAGARGMILISTDKAIEPVSILGATKRLAEMYCQALDHSCKSNKAYSGKDESIRLISVRFGNVLASTGSVVPKFRAQIEVGGPVTVTHPDMVRYFMTIGEACDLVLTAASHAIGPEGSDASVYVLNMGQPVRISQLAERMIRLSGLEPGRDVEIVYTGVRPGERLHEILFARDESMAEIGIQGIVAARPSQPSFESVVSWLATVEKAIAYGKREILYQVLREAVPDFRGEAA